MEKLSEIYANFGRFNVFFENMCHYMRSHIVFANMNTKKGNADSNGIVEILLAGMNVMELLQKQRSILHFSMDRNEEEKKIISKYYTSVEKLIQERNHLIHGTLLVLDPVFGHGEEVSPVFFKDKNKSTGYKVDEKEMSCEYLTELTNKAAIYANCCIAFESASIGNARLTDRMSLESIETGEMVVIGFMPINNKKITLN